MKSKGWVEYITDLLTRKLSEQGIASEVSEFDANELHAYYSATRIPSIEKTTYTLDWLDTMYFEPLTDCVVRGAVQENWTTVLIQVSVDDTDLIVIDLVEKPDA